MSARILAFGDSLTWGYDAATDGGRHPASGRWPEVLAGALGVTVIPEGLPGRSTAFDDHCGPADRNGARALPLMLASHQPLDLVIIMLGSNDLKPHVCGTAEGAQSGLRRLLAILRDWGWAPGCRAPKVLVLAPPGLAKVAATGQWPANLNAGDCARLPGLYAAAAAEFGAAFADMSRIAQATPMDGVHLDAAATAAIGRALAPQVAALLGLTPSPDRAGG